MNFGNAATKRHSAREAVYTNKRQAMRQAVYKGAQIILPSQSVFDCVVMNISTKGARVRTAAVMPVPERVSLQLRGGAVIPAIRRWTRGTNIGLEFAGVTTYIEERAIRARAALEILREVGVHATIKSLRAEKFFDDVELAIAAEEAKMAHARLEAVLKARATIKAA
jgi:hypothetical protein